MKLSDYVMEFLSGQGVGHVFGVTGGAVVHLFDSAARHPGLAPVFTHHEQAAAFAAVSYARIRGFGAGIFTTGPGGVNAMTGLLAAWQDSIPCMFISGQSRFEHMSRGKSIRQLGVQEFDILSVVKPVTKYAETVESPDRIRYHLEKAVCLARSGRPGPVWIDIPLNFQWAEISPEDIPGFTPKTMRPPDNSAACQALLGLLGGSRRPLILAGYGVRLAGAVEEFRVMVETLGSPFVSTWTACDIMPTDHPLYTGRVGITGQRGGNLAVQNCDLLIALGSHLSMPVTGPLFDAFARDAKIVAVDIDQNELRYRTVRVDLPVRSDVKRFLAEFLSVGDAVRTDREALALWTDKCRRYKKYNSPPKEWFDSGPRVNPYVFMDILSDLCREAPFAVDGGGTNLYISFQGLKLHEGQRVLLSSGVCSMGSGLPESIGACFAVGRKPTICLTGDGSLQFNVQELQTLVTHRLPVKIFVMNNDGYLAIRHTQKSFLEGRYAGSSADGGLTLPDFKKIAAAYGLPVFRAAENPEIEPAVRKTLEAEGPVLCELMVDSDQPLICSQGFAPQGDGTFIPLPLEDMAPFLPRREFLDCMITKPLDNKGVGNN
jgi:acetolactate synthase-1/2/3 large subunit